MLEADTGIQPRNTAAAAEQIHRTLDCHPGVEHLTVRDYQDRLVVTVFLTGRRPVATLPVIAEVRALVAGPRAVPGWHLLPDAGWTG